MRARRFPSELWGELGSRSLFGFLVDRSLGGWGGGLPGFVEATRRLSHSVATLAYLFVAQNLVSLMVAKNGSKEQLETLLPRLIRGEARVAMGLAEEASGSDVFATATAATRVAEGYRIIGRKDYVTDAAKVDALIVVAKSGEEGHKTYLSAFLVPTSQPGLSFAETQKMGLDFLGLYSVTIDTTVGPQTLLGREHEAWGFLSEIFALDRVALAAMLNGVSASLLEGACGYAKTRIVFGRPIGANQAVQFPLARAHAELLASQALVDQVASLSVGRTESLIPRSAAALYLSARCAYEAADIALQVKGAKGYTAGFEEACFRDVRYYRIGPLSEELCLSTIARRELHLPSS